MEEFRCGGDDMQLNEAVSKRLAELLQENHMTPYQLNIKSGVPKSTIENSGTIVPLFSL